MEGGRTVVVQGERHQRSLVIRTEDTGHVNKLCVKTLQGRIQDLVRGGSDKRPPLLSNCFCYLTSPVFTRKSRVKIFAFHFRGVRPNRPNHP